MNQNLINRAAEVIASRSVKNKKYDGEHEYKYSGEFCTIALIDLDGYPTASTITASKSEGIKHLWFLIDLDAQHGTKFRRIQKNNKASLCFNDYNEVGETTQTLAGDCDYNITLVGDCEILVDNATKEEMLYYPMNEIMKEMYPDGKDWGILKFTTKRYSIYFGDTDEEEKGEIEI